tara:strand:+ start:1335 stop:1859 length:525 start_codon:yes stop_codon:yes gene_type:complete
MFKSLNVIVCCDSNYGIGLNNSLPWNIKSEMKLFQNKTIGSGNNCVIMGKHTFMSIPKKHSPLKERVNCIVSSSFKNNTIKHVIRNLDTELESFLNSTNYDTYWIIGGESIYHKIMKDKYHIINELHISVLDKSFDCDTFFPEIDTKIFKRISTFRNEIDKYNHFIYKNTSYAS